MYNLVSTVKTADVWYSLDGGKYIAYMRGFHDCLQCFCFVYWCCLLFHTATWVQETGLIGDFYAQNADAMTPGDIAPWYTRFGHSLNVLTAAGYNMTSDLMILTGGYSPEPSNDVWITPDGKTWYFTGTTKKYMRTNNWVLKCILFFLTACPFNFSFLCYCCYFNCSPLCFCLFFFFLNFFSL